MNAPATLAEPGRIARLPHDKHGRPVPWFVAWLRDGRPADPGSPGAVPDFRIIRPGAVGLAVTARCCWVCGSLFARQEPRASLIGPMCVVNLVSAEPPSHGECATYSARACPFLATPRMTRRDRHLPAGTSDPPGTMIRRNPGVACVWVTKYNAGKVNRAPDGLLFDLGPSPLFVEWWAYGRTATRAEVVASIETGLPALQAIADDQGGDAPGRLAAQVEAAQRWIPTI